MESVVPLQNRAKLVEILGEGGMGTVYLADVERAGLTQRLALKVLKAEFAHDDPTARRQRDEARLLSQLNHDHIVKVMELTDIGGSPVVLMEYIKGIDALRVLRAERFPVRAALEVVVAVASALDAALTTINRNTGRPLAVVHRDIKPANLLISAHGGVKVLDFGIARADFAREGQTTTGAGWIGTLRYMSPEQVMMSAVTEKTDIFSLGITLTELVAGKTGDRITMVEHQYDQLIRTRLESMDIQDWTGRFAGAFMSLLGDMLKHKAEDRPTAAEVERRALDLIDTAPGTNLKRFARRIVPPVLEQRAQRRKPPPESLIKAFASTPLRGIPSETTLTLKADSQESNSTPTKSRGRGATAALVLTLLATILAGMVATVVVLGLMLWMSSRTSFDAPIVEETPQAVAAPDPVEVPDPVAAEPVVPDAVAPPLERPSEPRPAPTPEAESEEAPPMATVSNRGGLAFELRSPAGTYSVGELPAGDYALWAFFTTPQEEWRKMSDVTLSPDANVSIVCRALRDTCTISDL